MNIEIKHAWFSAKMAELIGTAIYRSANDATVMVECTQVNDSPTEHNCGYDDMQYLGLVCGWVRHGSRGTLKDN